MNIWQWLGKVFSSVKKDAAKIAVAITEDVQSALKSGILGALADTISAIFPNVKHLPQDVVAEISNLAPKVLAAELAVQGLPDNPTEQDVLDFDKKILAAFELHDDKSKLYSVFTAQVYGILLKHVGKTGVTFADKLADVEEAYQDLQKDKAAIAVGQDIGPSAE